MVLEVSEVTFADSSLLNLFIQARHRLNRLALAGSIPPQLQQLLDLTGAADIFAVAPDIESALRR